MEIAWAVQDVEVPYIIRKTNKRCDDMSQEQVVKALQDKGKRVTQQRRILIDVILNGNWQNCKEIYYEAVEKDPTIGMATVYRMMATLEEIGVVERRCEFFLKEDAIV